MASELGSIEDISDQKLKIGQYKDKLTEIFNRQDGAEIISFVDHSEKRGSHVNDLDYSK